MCVTKWRESIVAAVRELNIEKTHDDFSFDQKKTARFIILRLGTSCACLIDAGCSNFDLGI